MDTSPAAASGLAAGAGCRPIAPSRPARGPRGTVGCGVVATPTGMLLNNSSAMMTTRRLIALSRIL